MGTPTQEMQLGAVLGRAAAHTPAMLWRVGIVFVLILMYMDPLAKGVRLNLPDFGTKLWKTPFLTRLRLYEETRNLEGTHIFAFVLLCVAFFGWEVLLKTSFGDESLYRRFLKPENAKRFTMIVAGAALFTDCFFLYCGVANSSWGRGGFSLYALFATVGYLAVNVGVSLVSVYLSPQKKEVS